MCVSSGEGRVDGDGALVVYFFRSVAATYDSCEENHC